MKLTKCCCDSSTHVNIERSGDLHTHPQHKWVSLIQHTAFLKDDFLSVVILLNLVHYNVTFLDHVTSKWQFQYLYWTN